MIKFIPVPITDHDIILGKDFNKKFAFEKSKDAEWFILRWQ